MGVNWRLEVGVRYSEVVDLDSTRLELAPEEGTMTGSCEEVLV
jgi:hypothetical protein